MTAIRLLHLNDSGGVGNALKMGWGMVLKN